MLLIEVRNIRGPGCITSIRQHLGDIPGVRAVEVDPEHGTIRLDTRDESIRPEVVRRLRRMGYPEKGSLRGLRLVRAKAASLLSCAVGRMSDHRKH